MEFPLKLTIVRTGKVIALGPALISVVNLNPEIEVIGPVDGPTVAHMRNQGAARASGRWIFFCDNDCQYDLGNLLKVIDRLEQKNTKVSAVAGRYRINSAGVIDRAYHRMQRLWVVKGLSQRAQGQRQSRHLLGGCFLMKKAAWHQAQFDENIGWAGEELKLVQDLHKINLQTQVSFRLWVLHDSEKTLRDFLYRAWAQSYNLGYWHLDAPVTKVKLDTRLKRVSYPTSLTQLTLLVLFYGVGRMGKGAGQLARLLELQKWRLAWPF